MAVCIVVCMIVGYLFGCIQTGYIVGRVNKIDIRDTEVEIPGQRIH